MSEKHALLNDIRKLCFAMTDTTLFLDTHPCDTVAMDYYHYLQGLLKQAKAKYIAEYGPINNRQVECAEEFTWVDKPWPWEGGCC